MKTTTTTTRTRTAGMTRKGESRALCYAGVAEWLKRRPCNADFVGSIPIAGSKKNMNTLNTIQSITTARAVRVGNEMVLPADSSVGPEHTLDKREAASSILAPQTTEPLRERWRAPTHAYAARTGCSGNSKFLREEFESLALRCCNNGGSTDLFITGA